MNRMLFKRDHLMLMSASSLPERSRVSRSIKAVRVQLGAVFFLT